MRVVLQRVHNATAHLDRESVGEIDIGLVALVGFGPDDTFDEISRIASKVVNLRIFPAGDSFLGRSLLEEVGAILLISQFTLSADLSRGRRPNFSNAAPPDRARELFAALAEALTEAGAATVAPCPFASSLRVDVCNWGPLTVVVE